MQPTRAECIERIAEYKDDPMCRQAIEHFKRWLEFHDGVSEEPPEDISASADLFKTEMMEFEKKKQRAARHSIDFDNFTIDPKTGEIIRSPRKKSKTEATPQKKNS